MANRGGVPQWEIPKEFAHDLFTFARVQYEKAGRYHNRWGEGPGFWRTDWPDADLNLAFRLQQMTSLNVHPDGKHLRLTDQELFDYPFLYIVEPGDLRFRDEEVPALRRYLLNGGFLMVDDFWGDYEWSNFYDEMQRVFPGREPVELPLNHPLFHCVFDLKERPQVPNVGRGTISQYDGITWEYDKGPSAREVHYRAFLDDKERIMVLMCHNTDLGDGWEREGENEYYFREFSEKKAYPLGINIIFYAMTH
jgi:hypothetical protein